jgi:hypothetical protein
MKGDQRNLRVYGNPTNPNIPIVRRSTPDTVIHACNVPPVRARGRPEAKPRKVITAIRLLRKTARYGETSIFTSSPYEWIFLPGTIVQKSFAYCSSLL